MGAKMNTNSQQIQTCQGKGAVEEIGLLLVVESKLLERYLPSGLELLEYECACFKSPIRGRENRSSRTDSGLSSPIPVRLQ